ncbi:hypothetical protein FDP41_011414 [Naegleria fowleri]|uniref:RNA polymerase-associated protein LEO1 n=1 Tax=Naegleria fowleri TaxID=5763 RepID=A0A6A5C7L6_NAEFO|nr:uncharacterized protein FDP41_011414 [Naegleria fowleri]KAF0982484.1 hypothetical protein FDP41_011414 [Naegleria fowleri]CAG4715605.1 unnamed protein product [Naegleria fowleri]
MSNHTQEGKDQKATIEEIFGSDFEESEEEEERQVQEEAQSSSDKENEVVIERRQTRHSELKEKERLEEEQRNLQNQILRSQAELCESLFYNYESDDNDNSKPVLEIEHKPRPTPKHINELYFLRTPVQFNTDEKEYSEDTQLSKNDLYTIRWRRNEETGELESNTRVVQYADGTYQVFVGNEVILHLEAKAFQNWSNLHLFEKVNPFCYYGHGIFTHRLNTKATSTQTKGRDIALQISKVNASAKKKKTVLTMKRPESEENKKVMEEALNIKKKQQKKQQQYQQNLTLANASLEEGAESSSDEEGNVRKIKRNTLRKSSNKRRSYEEEEESADSAESEEEYEESSEEESTSKRRK